jgi:S-methylmethionine-dependent homocysteine/selenocysteine methylase
MSHEVLRVLVNVSDDAQYVISISPLDKVSTLIDHVNEVLKPAGFSKAIVSIRCQTFDLHPDILVGEALPDMTEVDAISQLQRNTELSKVRYYISKTLSET